MNFYGNDINGSLSGNQFEFDKKYPNKYIMDLGAPKDGVFIGRIVLIDYNLSLLNTLPEIHMKNNEWYLKENYNDNDPTKLDKNNFICGWEKTSDNKIIFYKWDEETNKVIEDNFLNSFWENDYSEDNFYTLNTKIDEYQNMHQTIWQKAYIEAKEKYELIADLSAEAPSIDLKIIEPDQEGNPTNPTLEIENSLKYHLGIAPNYGIKVGSISFGKEYFDITPPPEGAEDLEKENIISFELSGKSNEDLTYKDTFLFNANLPGLGKIAKTGWDLLYGENRNTIAFTPPTENNETPDNSKMNRNISSLLGSLNTYMEKVVNFEDNASLTNLQNDITNLQKYVGNYDAPEGEDYVDKNSLKLQIQNNDLDISLLQDQITNNDLDIENLQEQINNNDSDIINLQKYVGNYNPFEGEDYIDENSLYFQIINNDLDITNLQKYVGNYNPSEGEDYTDTGSLNKQIEDANETINILKNNINTLIEYIEKINQFLLNGHFLFSFGRDSELKNFSIEDLPALKKWPDQIQGQNEENKLN